MPIDSLSKQGRSKLREQLSRLGVGLKGNQRNTEAHFAGTHPSFETNPKIEGRDSSWASPVIQKGRQLDVSEGFGITPWDYTLGNDPEWFRNNTLLSGNGPKWGIPSV